MIAWRDDLRRAVDRDGKLASMALPFIVLTGASGSGKTTLARYVRQHHSATHDVFFFDSAGVPSSDRMIRDYGSGDAWQRTMTLAWMVKIGRRLGAGRPVLLEGQMRIEFILEAVAETGITEARVILADCAFAVIYSLAVTSCWKASQIRH
jgi:hypothetical protein